MINFIWFFIIMYLSIHLIHNQKIEDISDTFSFELINIIQKDSDNLTFDSSSTYIYPYNISYISNLEINSSFYKTLISTNLSQSIYISSYEENCDEDEEYETQVNNSQFIFTTCGPYLLDFSFPKSDFNFTNEFYNVLEIKKSNSELEYNAILSLPSLDTYSMIILDYINYDITIIKDDLEEDELNNFQNYLKTMIKCDNGVKEGEELLGKFSCKIDYLLLGMEGEKDDPYLAKEISKEKKIMAYFDNLSTYTIFPYEYLNYFLSSFFSKYNDECEEYLIEKASLYYIACSRKKVEIFSYARNMSVLINYHSFPLKNLLNDSLRILGGSYNSELIYLTILFTKNNDYFIFGTNFFMGKKIGYNFLDNCTYIYSSEYIDFTSDFSGENSSTFQVLLYCLTFGLFACLLILSGILTLLRNRKINRELKNIFND